MNSYEVQQKLFAQIRNAHPMFDVEVKRLRSRKSLRRKIAINLYSSVGSKAGK